MKQIIVRPVITEKTMKLVASDVYTFVVAGDATKPYIAASVAKQYGVTVEDVHTVITHGKVHRVGKRRTPTMLPDWKKAMVRIKKGQTIEAFQPPSEEGKKK